MSSLVQSPTFLQIPKQFNAKQQPQQSLAQATLARVLFSEVIYKEEHRQAVLGPGEEAQ